MKKAHLLKKIFFLVLVPWILFSCQEQTSHTVYLDSIPQGPVINAYGPPNKNVSFGRDTLQIAKESFRRGLGAHAPARWTIDLDRQAIAFHARVGIDDEIDKIFDPVWQDSSLNFPRYVYDNRVDHYDRKAGATVIFRVIADGDTLFESHVMKKGDTALTVEADLRGRQTLILETDPTSDGSYMDHANWALARITWSDIPGNLNLYYQPNAVLVNHVGYHPGSAKTCYFPGSAPLTFDVFSIESDEAIFSGTLQPVSGDLGNYLVGDFTSVTEPGKYEVEVAGIRSFPFEIGEGVYRKALETHLEYFRLQRSGHPTEGWAPARHLDDGIRDDTQKHQDVTGGWYDANDLRKPMKGNALLLMALAYAAHQDIISLDRSLLLEEMQWGNKFLFAMQEPEGYLMSYIGSTKGGYKDNRWTDDISGTDDDRTILTAPAGRDEHLAFVIANTLIYLTYGNINAQYATACLQRAERAYQWLSTRNEAEALPPNSLGMEIEALVLLHEATSSSNYREQVAQLCEKLLQKQTSIREPVTGHFFHITDKPRTYSGRWVMMGLESYGNAFPDDARSKEIEKAVRDFASGYYLPLAHTNTFHIIPWVLSTSSMESEKQLGPYYYRNFLHVGMNQHLSSQGCALQAAYRVTGSTRYLALAQRQLDWIYGANPFNASSVTGLGYNQPALFKTLPVEFKPHTPELTGGVMTGIGSNPQDKMALYPGYWWTTEYWSPTVTYTILLTLKLQENYETR